MNLLRRALRICTQPSAEWQVVSAEPTPPSDVLVRYVLPLALADAVVSFAVLLALRSGAALRGYVVFWVVFGVVWVLVACTVAAFVINAFASTFGGAADRRQAFKLAGYSATPILLLNLLRAVLPATGVAAILGIVGAVYAAALLFAGLPILMKAPQERALPYTLLVVVCVLVLMWVLMAIFGLAVMTGSLFTDNPFRIV